MKKRLLPVIILLTVFIGLFLFNSIILSPVTFKNNPTLDRETNREFKGIILESVKDYCSLFSTNDNIVIYDQASKEKIIHFDTAEKERGRGLIILIDSNFMNTLTQTGNDEYSVTVTHHTPEFTYYYHVTVKKIDDEYRITSFLVDI